jgi:hypothetical protein
LGDLTGISDRSRWQTGWIVLPGDPPLAHRPSPERPGVFMCRRHLPPDPELLSERPRGVSECGRCSMEIGRARKRALKQLERVARGRRRRVVDPEAVDRRDRARERGTSVRTVSGGLPTLGRH